MESMQCRSPMRRPFPSEARFTKTQHGEKLCCFASSLRSWLGKVAAPLDLFHVNVPGRSPQWGSRLDWSMDRRVVVSLDAILSLRNEVWMWPTMSDQVKKNVPYTDCVFQTQLRR